MPLRNALLHAARSSCTPLPSYNIRSQRFSSRRQLRAASAVSSDGKSHPLLDWVPKHGGWVWEGLTVQTVPGEGFGLTSSQACRAGQQLVELPLSCQLTYGKGESSDALLAVIDKVPAAFWGLRLAACVLEQRALGPASKFQTYIEALPAAVPGLPMFFPPDAVKALWYPPLTAEVARRGRFMFSFHKDVISQLPGTAGDPFHGVSVDLNGLGWALAVVTSRAFATRGPTSPRSLLPLIDMCNHSFNPNCDISKSDSGAITMTATRDIQPGDQMLLSYGKLDNHTLLLDYGFIVDDNPYDNVALSFDLAGMMLAADMVAEVDLKPVAWQKERLAQLKLIGSEAQTSVAVGRGSAAHGSLPLGVDPRLLTGAMILCASAARDLKDSSPQYDLVKAAATGLVSAYLELMVGTFGVDVERDQGLLQSRLEPEMRMAIKLRSSKVKMVQQIQRELATSAAQGMGSTVQDFKPALAAALKKMKLFQKEKKENKGFGSV